MRKGNVLSNGACPNCFGTTTFKVTGRPGVIFCFGCKRIS